MWIHGITPKKCIELRIGFSLWQPANFPVLRGSRMKKPGWKGEASAGRFSLTLNSFYSPELLIVQ